MRISDLSSDVCSSDLASGSVPSLPKADADIAYASATQQAHWVRTRQITSARLTDIYLERIGRIDSSLYAYITVTADLARKQALERDAELADRKSTRLNSNH